MTDPSDSGATEKPSSISNGKKANSGSAPFKAKPEYLLLSQGAEARIWKIPASDDGSKPSMIAKERFSKSYRHPTLDEKLTKTRCRAEGRILEKCQNQKDSSKCIQVPKVLRTEPPVLYIEFIEGVTVREYLEEHILVSQPDAKDDNGKDSFADNQELKLIAKQMGTMIAKLHNLGMVHGDLTTSNLMLRAERKRAKTNEDEDNTNTGTRNFQTMTMIDFGLAKSTNSAEERAVDLYVLERALSSTHPKLPTNFFDSILESYNNATEQRKQADATLQRLEQVRLRGRKRECFG